MRRKIVQIAVMQRDEKHPDAIVALADDGTLWLGDLNTHAADWTPMPPIPQPDPIPQRPYNGPF